MLRSFRLGKFYWITSELLSQIESEALRMFILFLFTGKKPCDIGNFVRRRTLSTLNHLYFTSEEDDSFHNFGESYRWSISESLFSNLLLLKLIGALLGVSIGWLLSVIVSYSSSREFIFIGEPSLDNNFKINFTRFYLNHKKHLKFGMVIWINCNMFQLV